MTVTTKVPSAAGSVSPDRLTVERVSKAYRTRSGVIAALEEVSLQVADGDFVCLVGPSGCGKSTLLNLIAGLDRPDRGRILAEGREVVAPGSDRMVVFQEPSLFPWLDVMDNVLFGLKRKPGMSRSERRATAEYFLELVGLAGFAHANVHELSGGMKQRVALARALAPDPRVLLMDEPFAGLDAMTREQLYRDVQEIWQRRRQTIVFVTHNVREAACLGNRAVLFRPRPGRVCESLQIDLARPRDINQVEVAQHATDITRALRRHQKAEAPA